MAALGVGLITGGSVYAVHAADFANWPQWRGPAGNGTAADGALPIHWSATNVLWKVPLPGKGSSTPVIWKRQIFVTAPDKGQDVVMAFDWAGKLLWQTSVGSAQAGKHKNGSSCNPSPITDGQRIFVYYYSGNLAALDLAGKILWQTNLVQAYGPEKLYWDMGTSPVLTKDNVIISRLHGGDSWVAAFDQATGALRWKTPRNYKTASEGDHAYSSPVVCQEHGQEALLVWGGEHLTAYEAAGGKLLWSFGGINPKAIANWPAIVSPLIAGDIAIFPAGRDREAQSHLYGVRMGGSGDVTDTHLAWHRDDTGTFVPSPVLWQGKLYLVRDNGKVECLDPVTGKTLWQDALPKDSAKYYASPIIAGGVMYAVREDGAGFVARVKDKFELLAENHLEEQVISSPVVLDGRLFIRGERHLFCVAAEPASR